MSELMVNIVEQLAAIFPQFSRVEIQRCVNQTVGPPELILQTCIDELLSRPVETTPDGQNAETKHHNERTTELRYSHRSSDSPSYSSTDIEGGLTSDDSLDETAMESSPLSFSSSTIDIESEDENEILRWANNVDLTMPEQPAQVKPAAGMSISPLRPSTLSHSCEVDSNFSSDPTVTGIKRKPAAKSRPIHLPNKPDNHHDITDAGNNRRAVARSRPINLPSKLDNHDLTTTRINRRAVAKSRPINLPNKLDNPRSSGGGQEYANFNPSNSLCNQPTVSSPKAQIIPSTGSGASTGKHNKLPGPTAPRLNKNGKSSTLTRQDMIGLPGVGAYDDLDRNETLPDIHVAPEALVNTTAMNATNTYRTKPDDEDDDYMLPDVNLAPLGTPETPDYNFNNNYYRVVSDIYLPPSRFHCTSSNTLLTSKVAKKRPLQDDPINDGFMHPPAPIDYIAPARLSTEPTVIPERIHQAVNVNQGQHDIIAQDIRIQVEVTGRRNVLPEPPPIPAPVPLTIPPAPIYAPVPLTFPPAPIYAPVPLTIPPPPIPAPVPPTIPPPAKQPSVQRIPDKTTAPAPVVKTPSDNVDPLKAMATEVLMLVPDVEPEYLRTLLQRNLGTMAVNNVCNFLLEERSYPKVISEPSVTSKESPPEKTVSVDYYKDRTFVNAAYREQCTLLLMNEFRSVSAKDIRMILCTNNNRYAPSKKCLVEAFTENGISLTDSYSPQVSSQAISKPCIVEITKADGTIRSRTLSFIKHPRQVRSMIITDPLLRKEVEFLKQKTAEESEKADFEVALQINENEYEDKGQLIECGCCYGSFAFEIMVQCYEGHLFCSECLKQYAQESVFGGGKANLMCMTDGCDATYPMSQLERALPSAIMDKYQDRVKEESLNLADISDLVRCPHCEFAAIMDSNDKVFKCQNEYCKKETCRYCKEDWTGHFGIPCKEMEKKDETQIRLQFEEKMTVAKIRSCHRCKASFTKSDGCNKMTCRCGAKMCYLCRQPNIDYSHFCQHPRDPGKVCTTCKACSLWTNPEEDDERAVQEIQKKASEVRVEKGFTEDKIIGAPPEAKKQRKS